MKLYDAAWAPSPRRVRIYLAEKGIHVERVTIDLARDEHLGPDFLAINPRGTVPALALSNGEILTESAAICRFFETLHPDPPLFGVKPVEVGRIENWTRRIESEGYAAAVYVLRNAVPAFAGRAEPGRWPAIAQIPELATRGRVMWGAFVDTMDARLAQAEWVAGERYSFADITALVTIDFARAAKLDVPDRCAHVARWYAAMGARPGTIA